MASTSSLYTILTDCWDTANHALKVVLNMVHTHANDAGGGTLDWDNVWSDAVHSHASDAEGGTIDHGATTGKTDDDHTQYTKHALATAANDFLVASGSAVFVKKTLAETKTVLGIPSEAGEGHIFILPEIYESIGQGTWALAAIEGTELIKPFENSTTADGDNLVFKVFLAAGTYTVLLVGRKAGDRGILDVQVDGTPIASFDLYNASPLYHQRMLDTGNVIATAGVKTLTLIINGKHASSSDHKVQYEYLVLWRTA